MSSSGDDDGGYAAREPARTREWIGRGSTVQASSLANVPAYERASPEAHQLSRSLRGAVADAGRCLAELESAVQRDPGRVEQIKERFSAASERATQVLAALGSETVPAGCLDAVQIRDARTKLADLSRDAESLWGAAPARASAPADGKDDSPQLPAAVPFAIVVGRDAADVRRPWITGSSHPQADRIRTDRMLEVLFALRTAGRFTWAADSDLDSAACAQTRLPSDQAGPIVTLEVAVVMGHHAGLPDGEPARIARRDGGLEIVFALPGGARDGEWAALDADAVDALARALEHTMGTGPPDPARLVRLVAADRRVLVRHGTAHVAFTAAECVGLLGDEGWSVWAGGQTDGAFVRGWLATNLGLAAELAVIDADLVRIIGAIDRHPSRSAIVGHARAVVDGPLTPALLETLAHDAVEAELARSSAARPVSLEWIAAAAPMAANLGLGSVEIRSDAAARTVTEAANARGVVHAGVVHLHPERLQPGTREGREVLAHELIHVAQARRPRESDRGRAAAESEAAALASAVARGDSVAPQYYIDLADPAADGDASRTVSAAEPTLPPGVDMQVVVGADAVIASRVWLTGSEDGQQIRADRMKLIFDALRATGRLGWADPSELADVATISNLAAPSKTKVLRVDLSASTYYAIGLPPGTKSYVNGRGDGLEIATVIPGLAPNANDPVLLDDDDKHELLNAIEAAVGAEITIAGGDWFLAKEWNPTPRHGVLYLTLSAKDCRTLFDAEQWKARTERIAPEPDYQVDYPPRPATEAQGDAITRLEIAYTAADKSCQDIMFRLVPAYLRARDDLDANPVAVLGGQILGEMAVVHGARAALPELIKSTRHISTVGTSAEEDLRRDAVQEEAEGRVVMLDVMIQKVDVLAASTMTPHVFRGQEVAGEAVVADVENVPHESRTQRLSAELSRTVGMLGIVHEITAALTRDADEIHAETIETARATLWPWRTRPLDFAFLRAALGSIWDLLDDASRGADALRPGVALVEARAQAQATGWLGDIGEFDMTRVGADLEAGGRKAAARTLQQLYTADPDARGGLVEQLRQRGLLDRLCAEVGWADVKKLHDSLGAGFRDAKSVLQSYFIGHGKWGPDITQEWNYHDVSLHSAVDRIPLVGGAINTGLDFATFGFNSAYGKALDDNANGLTSDAEMFSATGHVYMRTAVVAAASMLTGGAADGWIRGGTGAVSMSRAIGGGIAGGTVGATTALFTSDMYNVYISGEQDGFSSPEDYVKNALLGGVVGGTFAGVGQACGNRSARGATAEDPARLPGQIETPVAADVATADVAAAAATVADSAAPISEPARTSEAGRDVSSASAPSVGDFVGEARAHGHLDPKRVRSVVLNEVALVAPPGTKVIDQTTLELRADGRSARVAIAVGHPDEAGQGSSFVRSDDGNYRVTVSNKLKDEDVTRALAHQMVVVRRDFEARGGEASPSTRPSAEMEGKAAEMRVLFAEADRTGTRGGEGGNPASPLAGIDMILGDLGIDSSPAGLTRLHESLGFDPALARRAEMHLSGYASRPVVDATTDLAGFATSRQARLDDMAAHFTGANANVAVEVEGLALDAQLRLEEGHRIFDGTTKAKAARGSAAEAALNARRGDMVSTLNDMSLSLDQRRSRLATQIDELAADATIPESLKAKIDIVAMKKAVEDYGGAGQSDGAMTLDVASGEVTVPGAAADQPPTTLREIMRKVDAANQAAVENGVAIDYVLVVHRPSMSSSGRELACVEILARRRPQSRVPSGSSPAVAPNNGQGDLIVEVGVGRGGVAAAQLTPPPGGLIVQTDYIGNAEIGQISRTAPGITDAGPVGAKGSVMVFTDFLMRPDVIRGTSAEAGTSGIQQVILNNVSAKFDEGQYAELARQLAANMADGATVEVQWTMSPESPGAGRGSRWHIQGDKLVDYLDRTGRQFTYEELPVVGDDFTIDAATRADADPDRVAKYTAPVPEHRIVITFHDRPNGGTIVEGSKP